MSFPDLSAVLPRLKFWGKLFWEYPQLQTVAINPALPQLLNQHNTVIWQFGRHKFFHNAMF